MSKPLRIGLIMQGDRHWLGGVEYVKNIVLALASLPTEVRSTFEIYLFCSNSLNASFYETLQPFLHNTFYWETDLEPPTLSNRIRWKILKTFFNYEDPAFETFVQKQGIDFIYPQRQGIDFTNSTPYQVSRQKPYRSAAWIYDFQHKYLPQFFTPGDIQIRDRMFTTIANQASTIVLSSKAAEADFHQFFPDAAHKTTVLNFKTLANSDWYEGDPEAVQKDYCLPDRFFLVSNQFWQHKNHLTVFKALKLLQAQSIYPNIVFTGYLYDARQPTYSDTILQTIHKWNLAQQTFLLGLIPKFEQIQLMRRSLAVIQPSLFEGWSTLVEDARCMGKRLILSDLPVHQEQNPPNSVYFNRESAENLAELMADWWKHLPTGPNLVQEELARSRNLVEVKTFGQTFLKIAQDS